MKRRSLEKFIIFTAPFLACLHLYTQWAGSVENTPIDRREIDPNNDMGLRANQMKNMVTSTNHVMETSNQTSNFPAYKKGIQIKNSTNSDNDKEVEKYEKHEKGKDNVEFNEGKSTTIVSNINIPDELNSFIEKHQSGPKLQFGSNFHVNHTQSLVAGKPITGKVFMTIGIPTVKRDRGVIYVTDTLKSLVSNTKEEERKNVVFVVLLADFENTSRTNILEKITVAFSAELNSGLIQVIQAPFDAYPPLKNLPKKYNDPADRVFWRSKQNVDYAFLMLYCKDLSQYYMQIEDDVSVASNYMADVRRHLTLNTHKMWAYLRFSTLGFIGIFVRTSDLESFANFLLLLYAEMPCDWLMTKWQSIKGQAKDIVCKPTLFQHRGYISTLKGQRRNNYDKAFKDKIKQSSPNRGRTNNPPAIYRTDMKIVKRHPIANAYEELAPTAIFWAEAVKKGQYLEIELKQPFNASYIQIITGKKVGTKNDRLEAGTIKISVGKGCNNLVAIGAIFEGEYDSRSQKFSLPYNLSCVHIVVDRGQKQWLAIRNIILGNTKKSSR